MSEQEDIITTAKKQRHIVLLKKVRDGKALNKNEVKELKRYERERKAEAAKSGFTLKQQRLIDAYDGDIQSAAKAAGLSYGYARQLLTKHHNVRKAIHDRQEIEIRPTRIATRQERQNFWTTVMLDENVEYRDRLRASELLGRSEADFTENMSHTFPEGCGVLAVGKPLAHDDFAKEAAEHYKNGKNGNNGKNGKNPNDGDDSGRGDSGRGDSGGVVRG